MAYYVIDPEVAGGWGKNTKFVREPGRPTSVTHLHYELEAWPVDDLLESTPCFVVTASLASSIIDATLTGVEFRDIEITKSESLEQRVPRCTLPQYVWLSITGEPGRDDFGVLPNLRLVVSERALMVLRRYRLVNAIIGLYTP